MDICEGLGNRSGTAGYAILAISGTKQFRSNFKFSHEECAQILKNKQDYIGKYATVKYFNLTPDGVPRFPYIIKFREGEGKDN